MKTKHTLVRLILCGTMAQLRELGFCKLCKDIRGGAKQAFNTIGDLSSWWFGERHQLSQQICQ